MATKTGLLFFLLQLTFVLCVKQSEVTFRHFNRENPQVYQALVTDQLQDVNFDGTKPVIFIIHGYTDNAGRQWVIDMKDALLEQGDYNIIAVDWSGPALALYPLAAIYTRDVGMYCGLLIINLNTVKGVSYDNVYLVGHSLGAHVSGFTGKYLKANVSATISRITGMDPAGPEFRYSGPEDRLSVGDATRIDVIHTDGNKYGYLDPLGDADFYPNGGISLQPGCLTRDLAHIIACSHSRSFDYFTETVKTTSFVGRKCNSISDYKKGKCKENESAIMGFNVDPNSKGSYYLTTNRKSPFARNDEI